MSDQETARRRIKDDRSDRSVEDVQQYIQEIEERTLLKLYLPELLSFEFDGTELLTTVRIKDDKYELFLVERGHEWVNYSSRDLDDFMYAVVEFLASRLASRTIGQTSSYSRESVILKKLEILQLISSVWSRRFFDRYVVQMSEVHVDDLN